MPGRGREAQRLRRSSARQLSATHETACSDRSCALCVQRDFLSLCDPANMEHAALPLREDGDGALFKTPQKAPAPAPEVRVCCWAGPASEGRVISLWLTATAAW